MRKEVLLWWKQALEDFETAKVNLKEKKFYASEFLKECKEMLKWLKNQIEKH